MASDAALRHWHVHKAARRPIPPFTDDDYLDYMILEAIAVRVFREEEKAQKKRERDDWKSKRGELRDAVAGTAPQGVPSVTT